MTLLIQLAWPIIPTSFLPRLERCLLSSIVSTYRTSAPQLSLREKDRAQKEWVVCYLMPGREELVLPGRPSLLPSGSLWIAEYSGILMSTSSTKSWRKRCHERMRRCRYRDVLSACSRFIISRLPWWRDVWTQLKSRGQQLQLTSSRLEAGVCCYLIDRALG